MFTFVKKTVALISCAARDWSADSASNTGAALAFFCAFSLAPLLVIILTLAGWVVGAATAQDQVGAQLNSLFGPATAKTLIEAMKNSQQGQGVFATAVSIVTLAISATTVLAALNQSLQLIWKSAAVTAAGWRGWVRTRFLSFGFILALGFLLLVSLTISTGIAGLRARLAAAHIALVGVIGILDTIVSLLLVSTLFALIFRYMPARRLPWKIVCAGGILTALLFDAGRWLVGLYLAHSTQPSAFGAAASFAALLLWLYYTAQIFLFGAEFTACLGGLRSAEESATEPRNRG